MHSYTLYGGQDSLDVLTSLDDGSVDLIVTSPPYADRRASTYGGVKPDEYVRWFLPFAAEMHRVLSDHGSLTLNIRAGVVDGQRNLYVMKLVIAMVEEQGWRLVDDYVWSKTTTTPGRWEGRFRDAHEDVFHFAKAKGFTFNQDDVKVPAKESTLKRYANVEDNEQVESTTGSGYTRNPGAHAGRDMVLPSNVLTGASETGNKGHSAVYPLWLPEFFVKLLSNPGDVVLDPFVGSGTTALAALSNGRNAIGVEQLPTYADLGSHRVLNAAADRIATEHGAPRFGHLPAEMRKVPKGAKLESRGW